MHSRALLRIRTPTSATPPCRCVQRLGGQLVRRFSASSISTQPGARDAHSPVRLSSPYPPPTSTLPTSSITDNNVVPVSVEEFSTLLTRAGVPPTARLAIGLSGGADSSALALLAHYESQHSSCHRPSPLILQVDHRLRPESAAETLHCSHWLSQLEPAAPTHVVLPLQWADGRPVANRVQEVAREERREAMVRECGARRVEWLLLAHHAGDQMETIVHRWTRGSGLYGLTGMAARHTVSPGRSTKRGSGAGEMEEEKEETVSVATGKGAVAGVVVCRPLLSVRKARLVATCRQYGVRWVEDISNDNRAFERIRIRHALKAMLDHHSSKPHALSASSTSTLLPLNAELLASVPAILSSCQQSVHTVTTSLLRHHATFVSPFSAAFLSASAASLPFPILLFLFSRLLAVVRGSVHLPLGEPLHQLVRSLLVQRSGHSATSAASEGVVVGRRQGFGCVVSSLRGDRRGKRGGWMVTRALEQMNEVAVSNDSSRAQQLQWDDRFVVQLYLPPACVHPPAGCHTVDYVLRPLCKADLSLFELPEGSSTGELRHTLLTGLPLLVRRWTSSAGGGKGGSGEDVVLLPHVPYLPMKEVRWDEAERVRRAGDDEIQLTVTRLTERVSRADWTQGEDVSGDTNEQM